MECSICENAKFFSGKTIFSLFSVDIRPDIMYRPQLIVVPTVHEDHYITNQYNPFVIVRLTSCINSFIKKYNIQNYNIEYRSGSWNSHRLNNYLRITLDAVEFIKKFSEFLNCSEKKWWVEYERSNNQKTVKKKSWISKEVRQKS